MKKFLKWIGIGILAIIGFSFAIALSPLLLIGGGIAWIILRRKKSEKERFAKWITIAGVVGLAILMFMPASSTETDTAGVTEETTNMVKEPVTAPVKNEDNETEQEDTEVQKESEKEEFENKSNNEENTEEVGNINRKLETYLHQNKGWANGTIDENGNPTENGTPYPEYKNWNYVNSIEFDGSNVEMQVTADFEYLSKVEKESLASSAQGITMSIAQLETRPRISIHNGENILGRSEIFDKNSYEFE